MDARKIMESSTASVFNVFVTKLKFFYGRWVNFNIHEFNMHQQKKTSKEQAVHSVNSQIRNEVVFEL